MSVYTGKHKVLGHVVDHGHINIDLEKVRVIQE